MTSYDVIYKRFLNKITDFNISEMDDYSLNETLREWLGSAIVNTRTFSNLDKRDEEEGCFLADLLDVDIELLACGMTLAWIDQYLNSTELTQPFIGGKEEKFYSQANQIAELNERRKDIVSNMHQLYTYHTYHNNPYFG